MSGVIWAILYTKYAWGRPEMLVEAAGHDPASSYALTIIVYKLSQLLSDKRQTYPNYRSQIKFSYPTALSTWLAQPLYIGVRSAYDHQAISGNYPRLTPRLLGFRLQLDLDQIFTWPSDQPRLTIKVRNHRIESNSPP